MNNAFYNQNIRPSAKAPKTYVYILLYVTFCFAGWYAARGTVAILIESYFTKFAGNRIALELIAFFSSGILPFAFYYIIVKFFGSALRNTPNLCMDEMVYYLPYFCMGANVAIGGTSIIFYFYPIASVWGGIISPMLFRTIFFAAFLWFICKKFVKPYNRGTLVMYFGKLYLRITVLLLVINLLSAVIR